eukprot:gene35586-46151_t
MEVEEEWHGPSDHLEVERGRERPPTATKGTISIKPIYKHLMALGVHRSSRSRPCSLCVWESSHANVMHSLIISSYFIAQLLHAFLKYQIKMGCCLSKPKTTEFGIHLSTMKAPSVQSDKHDESGYTTSVHSPLQEMHSKPDDKTLGDESTSASVQEVFKSGSPSEKQSQPQIAADDGELSAAHTITKTGALNDE